MHPESQHHDVPRDPILDGRDSLRLVKLRLALTLIAVAVLPIAAVSPLVRAVAEEARVAHHERLVDQAQTAAFEVRREITVLREATVTLLADRTLVAAAAEGATSTDRRRANERLERFVQLPGSIVVSATLLTGTGVRATFGPSSGLTALPPGVL